MHVAGANCNVDAATDRQETEIEIQRKEKGRGEEGAQTEKQTRQIDFPIYGQGSPQGPAMVKLICPTSTVG